MIRALLSNTSVDVLFDGSSKELMEANVGDTRGNKIKGTFLKISVGKSLGTLRLKLSKRPHLKHSYTKGSNLLKESINADGSDFATENIAEKEFRKSILIKVLAKENLRVNGERTEKPNLNKTGENKMKNGEK